MKIIILLFIATVTTFATFAQKSKANSNDMKAGKAVAQYACPMHPEVVSNKPGKCTKCNMDLSFSKKEQMKREVTKTYTCPMHQEVVRNNPGTCPQCSSKLVVDRTSSKHGKTVYTCSMHPDELSDKSGKCPVCGMEMTALKTKTKTKKV